MLTFALFLAFVSAWIALYILVIRPKLIAFRYTAGIYARLDVFEAGTWAKLVLLLRGLKVAIIGLVTSSAPVLAVFYDQISGLDWSKFLPDERAKIVVGVVALLGVLGPIAMVILHQGAIASASAATPVEPALSVPPSVAK